MKEIPGKWEADLRQSVEAHVFDYDREAWAQMEGLLEEVSPAKGESASDTGGGPTGIGGSYSSYLWFGAGILLGALVIGWWLMPKDVSTSTMTDNGPSFVTVAKDTVQVTRSSPQFQLPPATEYTSLPQVNTTSTTTVANESLISLELAKEVTVLRQKVVVLLPKLPLPTYLSSTTTKAQSTIGKQPPNDQTRPQRGGQITSSPTCTFRQ